MKNIFLLVIFLELITNGFSQQNYCNFEGIKFVNFGTTLGPLDTLISNPAPDAINNSAYCAKYIRDSSLYDNIKVLPYEKLVNVTPYANNTFQTPKMKMKVFTSAPLGTIINLQLGPKSDNDYPSGVHSEYLGVTSVKNAWEQITFYFHEIPQGSNSQPYNVDKIVLFFNPNTNTRDTFYFDDLIGPELVTAEVQPDENKLPFKLYQNIPNPAKESTQLRFQLNSPGYVSLKIYDLIGNEILTIIDKEYLKAGHYSFPLETSNISEGVYFYILEKDGFTRSMKMSISKEIY